MRERLWAAERTGFKMDENRTTRNRADADRPRRSRIEADRGREDDWETTNKRQKKEDPRRDMIKEILSTSIYLLAVLAATYLIIRYVGQRTDVEGSSMEMTLQDGDNLIVDKISYRFRTPERFDIIVFPFQYESSTYYIKRIIGMPGESVRIDWEGNIYIDGERLDEGYGMEVILDPGRAEREVKLGEDEYFVLGDNRNNSTDSRTNMVGNIHKKDIIGRAWVRIYPFNKFGKL